MPVKVAGMKNQKLRVLGAEGAVTNKNKNSQKSVIFCLDNKVACSRVI